MKVQDGYEGIVILVSLLLCTFENCHLKTFFKLIKRMFLLWDTQFIPRQYTWMKSGKKPNEQKPQWVKKFAKLWYKCDVYYIFFEGNYLQLHSTVMVYLPHTLIGPDWSTVRTRWRCWDQTTRVFKRHCLWHEFGQWHWVTT